MIVLLVPVGVIAAVSSVRAETGGTPGSGGRNRSQSPEASRYTAVAVAPAVALPVAAVIGAPAVVALGSLLLIGSAVLLLASAGRALVFRVLMAAFCPAVATAAVVLALGQGLSEALTLLAGVCLYDMASFMTGTGPRGGVVGILAGWVTIGVLAVLVAAVVVPPYSGHRPWILLGLVALLVPAGVFLCSRIGNGRRLPALRRLDSLVLAGPAWVIAVGILLHR
jgi:hypothetical protein